MPPGRVVRVREFFERRDVGLAEAGEANDVYRRAGEVPVHELARRVPEKRERGPVHALEIRVPARGFGAVL